MQWRRKFSHWYERYFTFICKHLTLHFQRNKKQALEEEVFHLPAEQFGRPKAPAGTWASCIRIIDPIEACKPVYLVLSLTHADD
jgi:hypothetical protein